MEYQGKTEKWYQYQQWYKKITVEPTMFFYMFAFMFTSVVEQAFFVHRACIVNHNYTYEICDDIRNYEDINKEVQVTVSNFQQFDVIAAHVYPIILALFLGAWSDKRGRKFPLIVGLFGKLIYSIMIIVNDNQPTWPLEYIIYTATIPCALTGADLAIFASCFAYISDVSSTENRTMRVTILEICYLFTMPTGVALGSFAFYSLFNKSYSYMFAVNAGFLVVAIIYSLYALKWQTSPKQRPLRELRGCQFIPDFFDKQHVLDSIKTLTKKRTMNRRLFLFILLISMALYTFVRDEKAFFYLYTQMKFKWDVASYSNFKTFQSSAYIVAMFTAVPIMNKVFKWTDSIIILFGCGAHAIARLIYMFSDTPLVFYLGGIVCSFGPIAGPALRALTSKIVPVAERGKVFALLAVCDNAVPFISGVLYAQVYKATIGQVGGIFLLSFSNLMLAMGLISIIQWKLGNKPIVIPDDETPDDREISSILEKTPENDISEKKY